MKPFARSERVRGQIQRVLAEVLKKKIKDPRLESVIITTVKLSNDLRQARIYYSTTSGAQGKDDVQAGLDSARGYLKRVVAGDLNLRYMPELRFLYDESFDYGSKIDRLLASLAQDNETDNRTH